MAAARRSVFADRLLEFPDLVFSDGREFSNRGRWREHFAARTSRQPYSLSPVLRGEGGGEGRVVSDENEPHDSAIDDGTGNRTHDDATRTSPLSPALSPEYREEGVQSQPPTQAFDGRLILEIGCNDAHLLAAVAAKHRASAFVGVDWKARALHAAATRVAARNLNNVALLHGRAQDIRRFVADQELDEVWIFHPEPLDNPREIQNRLIAEPFLLDVHAALRPGGWLALKTDHRGYFAASLELMARLNDRFHLAVSSDDFWIDGTDQSAAVAARPFAGEITPFESRFIRKRKAIYFALAEAVTS